MIKVNCEVKTYYNNSEVKVDMPIINIKSHWCRNEMVWIEINEEKHLVVAQDLIEAIKNCTNVNRY